MSVGVASPDVYVFIWIWIHMKFTHVAMVLDKLSRLLLCNELTRGRSFLAYSQASTLIAQSTS